MMKKKSREKSEKSGQTLLFNEASCLLKSRVCPNFSKAFTILELILVIVIIGVLTGLALPRMSSMMEGSRRAEAIAAISSIRAALERCSLMNDGRYWGCNTWDSLVMTDPGTAPNAHFFYGVTVNSRGYAIFANRNTIDGGKACATPNPCPDAVVGMQCSGEFYFCGLGDFQGATTPGASCSVFNCAPPASPV